MKIIRTLALVTLLIGSMGFVVACSSGSAGGCGKGCTCAPDRNCCDGCRQGTGCTCGR